MYSPSEQVCSLSPPVALFAATLERAPVVRRSLAGSAACMQTKHLQKSQKSGPKMSTFWATYCTLAVGSAARITVCGRHSSQQPAGPPTSRPAGQP